MNKTTIKIIVDVLMTIFMILSFVRWDGSPVFHIIVGSVCALFFAIHVCIHRKWLKAVTETCLAGKLNEKVKYKYVINVLLLAVWSITIITGFLAIGPYIQGVERSFFGRLHGIFARLGLLFVIFHIIQHRSQIVSYFKIKKTNVVS
ncbi:MAG: hypothetical protein FWC97_12405 [Treponema sp.]|nr:hypothetical protein [Treponema sp.]